MLFARRRAMYLESLKAKKEKLAAKVEEPIEDIQKAIDEAGEELPQFEAPKTKKSKGRK